MLCPIRNPCDLSRIDPGRSRTIPNLQDFMGNSSGRLHEPGQPSTRPFAPVLSPTLSGQCPRWRALPLFDPYEGVAGLAAGFAANNLSGCMACVDELVAQPVTRFSAVHGTEVPDAAFS